LTIVELLNTTVSKNYVENVIHSMADTLIVFGTDDNATIRTVNNAALNLLKYRVDELSGQSVKKILSADLFAKAHILLLNDLDKVKNIETTYMTSEGEEIPVRFSASVLKNIGGKAEGVIFVAQDIRENKKAEEKKIRCTT
jgi:two-component system, sporulation sensor kinase E